MNRKKIISGFLLVIIFILVITNSLIPPLFGSGKADIPFITRSGYKLMNGSQEFRFCSVNIPNYFIVEDPAPHGGPNWHRVTEFEQKDACETVKRLGGQAFRTYVFSVQGGVNVCDGLAHIYKSGNTIMYNEDLFQDVDRGLYIAGQAGLRVSIPLVDNWSWFGGCAQWEKLTGGTNFWADPVCKTAFKKFILWLVNRTNTITGVKYKDDPTIMAWELGNEIEKADIYWINEISAYLKSVDRHHLIMDGSHKIIPMANWTNRNIDILTTHYADDGITSIAKTARRYNKAYIYGEYRPENPSQVADVIDNTISSGAAGCMAWSLRFRTESGGFYYHSEFNGTCDSLHYPGFITTKPLHEAEIFTLIRNGAYRIRGLPVPEEPVPNAPYLLPVTSPQAISWQGSAGATTYIIQRSTDPDGPWLEIATNVSDAIPNCNVTKIPLYKDNPETGTFYYRIIAVNHSGQSAPSNVVGVESRD